MQLDFDIQAARRALIPRMLPEYMPHTPHPPQAAFLLYQGLEALYGGAAGGGKSDALLMAALQYADKPGYRALLLRRTYKMLSLPGALMDRAAEWLSGTPAKWSADEKTWKFPSGATLTFGFLETEMDRLRYQGAELQFVGFDELTQFTESQYSYLFSRLRRLKGFEVPVRMRTASNPGGPGHDWVKRRFIDSAFKDPEALFFPAKVDDNPSVDKDEYVKSLGKMTAIERDQLLNGNWEAARQGTYFNRLWFEDNLVDVIPDKVRAVRVWDFGFGKESQAGDPTAGVKVVKASGDPNAYVVDVKRVFSTPARVKELVHRTAEADGIATKILIEQEPGASGVQVVDDYKRLLDGYIVEGVRPTGSKGTRAEISAAYAEDGRLKLLKRSWNEYFIHEHVSFTGDEDLHEHDELVDTTAYAIAELASRRNVRWEVL